MSEYTEDCHTASVNFPDAPTERPLDLEKRRITATLRRIAEAVIMKEPEASELAPLADRLDEIAAAFEPMPRKRSRTGFASRISAEDVRDFMEFSPLVGQANPVAPPIALRIEGEKAIAEVNFSKCFEGAPGHVHGGFVSAIFDEVLGFAQGFSGQPGMTGTLTITYRAPTPLLTDLRIEATCDRIEGRKIFTSGRLYAGETLCVEGTGLFISLKEEHYEAVRKAHGEVEPDRV